MSIPNTPSLGSIKDIPVSEIMAFSGETLSALIDEARAMKAEAERAVEFLYMIVGEKYRDQIKREYSLKVDATGAVRVVDNKTTIVVNTPKRTQWDQQELRKAFYVLGEGADHFRKVVLGVDERAYQNASKSVKAILAPARTVKTGKRTFKFEIAKH